MSPVRCQSGLNYQNKKKKEIVQHVNMKKEEEEEDCSRQDRKKGTLFDCLENFGILI